jgi:phosphoribosyl 1,2-cyclic phosphodiesterase
VAVHITILGSGSSGNCTYVETEHARLLIDAGLSGRQIRNRLLSIGRTVENLTGILLTHEHSDHCQGLTALAGKVNVPVYCNRLTREAIDLNLDLKPDFRLFSTGASFDAGDVVVDTFSVPHDAYDPVGFMLRTPGGNIGFLTDLGHATKLVIQRVRSAHVLVLEANHDMKMLQDDTRRPWSIKQRILSRHGHLSNDAAATAAQEIVSSDLEHVFLGHLSSDCNRPELARYAVAEALDKIGARNVGITVSMQDSPTPTYCLNRPPLVGPQAGYELRSDAEPIFDQGDLFMGRTTPALRPIPIVPRTTPPPPGLSQ